AIEFCGELIRNLSMEARMTLCNMAIEYTKENQKLTRENSKSAGSFRDTKTYINLVVEKNTESQICEKLLDDVEKYFIGGG
ncbi:aconitase family protein, partial [Campylobacter jejuni]|uniref:aconitase family protein n=1 Tax=Campylobacter jejuni TaxID=197 RepID=UPI00207BC2A1